MQCVMHRLSVLLILILLLWRVLIIIDATASPVPRAKDPLFSEG